MRTVNKACSLIVLVAVFLAGGGCRSRTDRTAGPVLLTFGQITGIPTVISVSGAVSGSTGSGTPPGAIGTFTLQSVLKDPNGTIQGSLENVEVSSYQVVYVRKDSGTRVPPPLVAALTVEVPVGGTANISNLPVVRLDQLLSPPLGDLASSAHRDSETGTQVIVVDARITFFGHTLSGDSVSSSTADFTLEFVP
jgi:hypothetical protein